MSETFKKGKRSDIKNDEISKVLKLPAMKIDHPEMKKIKITDINTHYLRSGGGK